MKNLHLKQLFIVLIASTIGCAVQAQAWLATALNEYQVANVNNNTFRLNRTSIGQALPLAGAPLAPNDFKLRVFGGAFTQVQQGTYGNFTTADQWIGLGQNPTLAGIYGLGMHRTDRYAFYNLDSVTRVAPTKDLIIGLGSTGTNYDPNQRILMKGFFGALINNSRVLLSANPARGAVGINDENPLSTFFVNATGATGSANFSPFRSMFIINRGTPTNIALSTFSAMGQEGNSVLNLPVHGFRTQAGDSNATVPLIAANFSVNTTSQLAAGRQEAEIQWQDLNYVPALGFPANYTGTTQDLLSFYFRTGNNNINFRRRVMTMIGGGHVGINIPAGDPVVTAGVNPFVAGNFFNTIRLEVRQGSVLSQGYYAVSDSASKIDVKDIENPFKLLDLVKPRSYTFLQKDIGSSVTTENKIPQFGFVAQEVARTEMGRAAAKLDDGSFAVEYNQFIPVLVAAVKEQQRTIATQRAELDRLNAVVARQAAQTTAYAEWSAKVSETLGITAPPSFAADGVTEVRPSATSERNTELLRNDFPNVRLLQNSPNPTNGYTEIFYECNEVGTVAITITDQQGRVRKVFNNLAKGLNKVVVNRNDLAPGIYTYSITIGGKVAASKQMVVIR